MYPVNEMDEFSCINTDLQQAPFSFMKNIFWRSDISLEESTGQQILRHELAHIKEKHTWDKLFMQFVLSLFWMNPFYWLIQKELYLIHEFIADEKAVDNKDASAFAAMLLHAKFGQSVFAPAQSFFYSPIKRRLIMLTSSGKTRFSYLRRMMALPLLAATVVLFAFRLQKENPDHSIVRANAPFKLVVDAGHGGTDNGAVGINGLKEKDINLARSKKIKELSAEYGVQVVLQRETDVTMKTAEKVDFSNAQNADAFISVHTNTKAAEDAERKSGVEIFISPDNIAYEKSRILGSALIQSLDKSFTVNKPLMQRKTGIWVLKKNEKPAVLIESGYIDHPGDARLMTDAGQLEKMARTILEGVVLYANQKVAQPYGVELIGASNTDTTLPKPVPLYVLNGKIIDGR